MQGPGISSEAIWTAFEAMTTAETRYPKWGLSISWLRQQDSGVGFATVGSSLVGGIDLVKGVGVSAVTSLDLFEYADETDRVISVNYDRRLTEPLGGTSIGLMTVLLDNSDKRFTPDYNGTIGTAILPKRPVNAHIGFLVRGQTKLISIFKGLTKRPEERKERRNSKIECQDYVSYLNGIPLESAKYKDQRTDEIIEDILSGLGFGSSQYALDTGLNTIAFAYFQKGVSAGYVISKLCESEEAVFYVDENGILRFENRRKYSQAPYTVSQHTIGASDIISWEEAKGIRIINKVIVKAKPRVIRTIQDVWSYSGELEIEAGATSTVWSTLIDPVDAITDPASTTDYTAFTATGGGGANITADIDIDIDKFTTSAKLEITNNNASKAYVNLLKLRATPATYIDSDGVSSEISEVYQDDDSINKYDEQEYTIENNYVDDGEFALELAQHIVNKYKNPNKFIKLKVQGIPHLQLRDKILVEDFN